MPANSHLIAIRTYRWEGFFFNAACAVYFLFFASEVIAAANIAMDEEGGRVIWLGILLAAISVAEVWAFPVKMRFVNEAIRDNGDSSGRAFYLWIFHTVISVVLIFLMAGSFGTKITGESGDYMPWWLKALIFVTVVKELVLLGFLWVRPEKEATPNPKFTRPSKKEWLADLILIVYACIAYSATWSTVTRGTDLNRDNPILFATDLFVAILLFLIFYLPLRIPYWVEEMAQMQTAADAWRLVGSIVLVLVPVIVAL